MSEIDITAMRDLADQIIRFEERAEANPSIHPYHPETGDLARGVASLIAELRAAREVVEAAKAWQRVYRSTGPREYMTRALNERARLSAVLDALAGAK